MQRPKKIPWTNGLAKYLSSDDLPPSDIKRWSPRRKAEVAAAVTGGLLTPEEACGRYGLSAEELSSWQSAYQRHGVGGLRVTRIPD